MSRREFSDKVRERAYDRAKGHCQKCTAPLAPGKFAYDHILPDWLGGEPVLANCQVLCDACHREKTAREDQPRISKTKRQRRNHIGKMRTGRGFPPPHPRKPASTPLSKPLPPRRLS